MPMKHLFVTLNDVEMGTLQERRERERKKRQEERERTIWRRTQVFNVTVVNSFIHLKLFASTNALGIQVIENLGQNLDLFY